MGAVVEYYDIATNDEEVPLVLKIVVAPHASNQVISVPLHQVINLPLHQVISVPLYKPINDSLPY